MKVKAVSVRVMELFTDDGKPLGLFKVDSEWQGMRKLVLLAEERGTGHPGELRPTQSLIVDSPGALAETFSQVFGAFGEHRLELDVVKASPDLAVLLK